MSGTNEAMFTERFRNFLDEVGSACAKRLEMVPGSLTFDGDYAAATALARSDQVPPTFARHEILAKLFIAESDEGLQEWVLLFHYLDGQRVAPASSHHLRLVRKEMSGVAQWKSMGWETDEYQEWSDLDCLSPEEHQRRAIARFWTCAAGNVCRC